MTPQASPSCILPRCLPVHAAKSDLGSVGVVHRGGTGRKKTGPRAGFRKPQLPLVLIAARDLFSVDNFDLKGAFALLAHDLQRQCFAFLKAAQNAHGVTGIPRLALTDP